MDIETRVTNLENMLASIANSMVNQKFYIDADIAGCRHTEDGQRQDIDKNIINIDKNIADIDYIAMETGVDLDVESTEEGQ